ncbi:MAG: recombination regulator RecX [Burkholderiales bacterium]
MREPPSLESRALKLLSRREHSRAELQKKLAAHAETQLQLDALLDSLQERGWLSEARFAETIINMRRARFGAARIAHELRQKGVNAELVDAHAIKLRETELEAVRNVWQKKFGKWPRNNEERGRQVRFLQNRGFASEVIFQLLREKD